MYEGHNLLTTKMTNHGYFAIINTFSLFIARIIGKYLRCHGLSSTMEYQESGIESYNTALSKLEQAVQVIHIGSCYTHNPFH